MAYPYTYEDGEDITGSGYGNTAFSAATQGTTLADLGTYDLIGGRYGGPTQTFAAPVSNKGNPTSQISKGTNTFAVGPQTAVRLINNATGEVVFEGVGYDAAQKARDMAQGLTDAGGRKANWDIQAATPGMSGYATVAHEKANKSTLGKIGSVVGTALPIAMIPLTMGASAPLAGLGTAGTIGLGAGVGGVSAGLKGQNILKGALMGGATAAGGQLLGGATGPLSKLGLSTDVATAVGTGLGATGGGLATGQSLKNSLIGGVTAGGATYLGGKLFGPSQNDIINQNVSNAMRGLENGLIDVGAFAPDLISAAYTGAGVLDDAGRLIPFSPDGALPAPWANGTPPAYPAAPVSSAIDPAMVVTGTRLSGPNFAGASNLFTPARYSGDGPTPSEILVNAKKDVPTTEGTSLAVVPGTSTPSEILVNAKKDVPAVEDDYTRINPVVPDFNAGLSDEIKVTAPKKDVVDLEDKSLAVNLDVASTLAGTGPKVTDKVVEPKSDLDKALAAAKAASLLIPLLGGGGGGGAGTGRYNTGKGALNPIFSAKLPTPGTEGAFTVGGLGGTAGGTDPLAARPTADWYRYATGPAMDIPEGADLSNATSPYAGFGPGTLGEETFKQVTGMSHGGAMGYARGSSRDSFAVEGPGTGRSDDIPAVLSDGEYVIDAETVALLGDGSSRAGAKKLDELRVKVRKHKGKNLAKGKFSVNAKHPEAYMLGGRI
jgi:hypothetical protein